MYSTAWYCSARRQSPKSDGWLPDSWSFWRGVLCCSLLCLPLVQYSTAKNASTLGTLMRPMACSVAKRNAIFLCQAGQAKLVRHWPLWDDSSRQYRPQSSLPRVITLLSVLQRLCNKRLRPARPCTEVTPSNAKLETVRTPGANSCSGMRLAQSRSRSRDTCSTCHHPFPHLENLMTAER